jgi:transcriptional regulator with XRE-family HTH domain
MAHLKLREVAVVMDVDIRTVQKWEAQETSPRVSDLPKLAEALGVSQEELLNGPTKNEVEIRVIIEETDDWEVGVMDLTGNGKDRFSVHTGPNKIGVEVSGKFDGPEDLDNVFARARKCAEETLAAQGRLAGI